MKLKPALPGRARPRRDEISTYERTLDRLTVQIDVALRDPEIGARAFMILLEGYAELLLKLKLLLNGGARERATRSQDDPGAA